MFIIFMNKHHIYQLKKLNYDILDLFNQQKKKAYKKDSFDINFS